MTIISIDAMGSDYGPSIIIEGLERVAKTQKNLRFQVYGQEDFLHPLLKKNPAASAISQIIHCDGIVRMEDNPIKALRSGRSRFSMWKALESVKNAEADACVSAANTGALMAFSKICLSTITHVERPAIAAIWPHVNGQSIVLDVGATVHASASQLVHFALLGAAMARAVFGKHTPSVGILNIGVEESKGQPEIKEANHILKGLDLNFIDFKGFVEGSDIGKGCVDVIVTEGFVGNIALKTAEGTAHQIATNIKQEIQKNTLRKLEYMLAYGLFRALKKKMDIRHLNGGVFLGLKGIVVKSHGSSDSTGFASAVDLAIRMTRNQLLSHIESDFDIFYKKSFINPPSKSYKTDEVLLQD